MADKKATDLAVLIASVLSNSDLLVVADMDGDGSGLPESNQLQIGEFKTAIFNDGSLALFATSNTERALTLGLKTFTVEDNRPFLVPLSWVQLSDRDSETNWMVGQVTSYAGTTLTVDVTYVHGSGSCSNWAIGLAGEYRVPASAIANADGTLADATRAINQS